MGGKRRQALTNAMPGAVAAVFKRYPRDSKTKLLELRQLIFDTANEIDGVGEITETLKWGEPSYLTEQSKSGTTIRIGWRKSQPDDYALFLNCQTTLISDFRTVFDSVFVFEGNRAIVMSSAAPLPVEPLRTCIRAALTYHRASIPT